MTEMNHRSSTPTSFAGRLRHAARALVASRDGLAAVEFGLALPVFLLMVYGTIEVGRLMWSDHALGYSAEQGARYALANPLATNSQIKTYAESQLITVDKSAVTVTVGSEVLDGITYLTVNVVYPFQALLPFVPFGSVALTGISRVPTET